MNTKYDEIVKLPPGEYISYNPFIITMKKSAISIHQLTELWTDSKKKYLLDMLKYKTYDEV